MSDEESSNYFVLEVSPGGGETVHWMVSWAADESTTDEDADTDALIFESRGEAIEHAKARARMIKDPVRIVVHEGAGYDAEAWVEDEWSPFHESDDRSAPD
ncbi:hypothetical protein Q0601_17520 [Paracoccus onubensis]|uniref:hypothetical protein n=1 Tax=Paracoccus onubensis TaxID=1675788 RepID=UPI002731BCE2|nr:hypothetical protein [Paracoccus onubensis]MDP0928987.1 hypothetical protein [Paracoccus onubensis]